jgi:hypothetical protein
MLLCVNGLKTLAMRPPSRQPTIIPSRHYMACKESVLGIDVAIKKVARVLGVSQGVAQNTIGPI